jgi:large subunit ribosomal protein L32
MAHPKHKISKSKRGMRRSQKKLHAPNLSLCPQCHEPKLPHHVCLSCGTYKGQEILVVDKSS